MLEHNAPIRVFVRSPEKVADLPQRVERVVGTLENREAVERAVQDTHAAFFVSPHDDAEEQIAENFISACGREGIRLVFAGVHADGANQATRFVQRPILRVLLPHYAPKFRIAERVRTSRTSPVLLVPGNYYQNDEICRDQIHAGGYPLPHRLVGRVDTRDVGEATARALLDPSVPSGAYALAGPDSLSGETTAANWSVVLGREVRYDPDIDLTDELLEDHYGGRKAVDFQKTYRVLAKFAVKTKSSQVEQTACLLGRPPRSHAAYVRDTVESWQVAAVA